MTTLSQVLTAVRAVIDASPPIRTLWPNEKNEIGDDPAPFAFVTFEDAGSEDSPVSFGGGRGNNRYRNELWLDIYVFVPNEWTLKTAADYAEQYAALFRSYRDSNISCFSARVIPFGVGSDTLKPDGMESEVGNYFAVVTKVRLFYDQIG